MKKRGSKKSIRRQAMAALGLVDLVNGLVRWYDQPKYGAVALALAEVLANVQGNLTRKRIQNAAHAVGIEVSLGRGHRYKVKGYGHQAEALQSDFRRLKIRGLQAAARRERMFNTNLLPPAVLTASIQDHMAAAAGA